MALKLNNLEGNEINDYARKALNQGRWGETWSVFKGNFGKIVLINLLTLVFCLPAIALLFIRNVHLGTIGLSQPFNSNTGLGYPSYTGMAGLTERIYLTYDLLYYSALIAAGFIAAVGIAGAAYSLKKLVNTHGEFTVKGFFHGVKVGYFNAVLPVTVFLAFFFASVIIGDWKDAVIAEGGSGAGPITAYVFIIIATVFVGIYAAWLLAVGISYKLKFTQLLRNSIVLMIGSPIQTIFFSGFALIPVWIYLIGGSVGFFKIIAYIIFILFGFSQIIITWMSYTQWVFDLYVTPNFKAAEESAKSKKTPQEVAADKEDDAKRIARELLAAGRSELIARPILPIGEEVAVSPLGLTYSRADLKRVSDDRNKLCGAVSDYEEEHKNDSVYVEYNKLFAEREKALKSEGKKGKKNKLSKDNLLK